MAALDTKRKRMGPIARTMSIKALEPEVRTPPSINQVGLPARSVEGRRTLIAVWCLIVLLIVLSVIAGFILWWKASSLSAEMQMTSGVITSTLNSAGRGAGTGGERQA